MTNSSPDLLAILRALAPHLRIAHHIAGRVRLKVDAGVLDDPRLAAVDQATLLAALQSLSGVRSVAFNRVARSCVIEYDNRRIPDDAWEALLAGQADAVFSPLMDAMVRERSCAES